MSTVCDAMVADWVFLSPPWGGPQYLQQEVFDVDTMIPVCGGGRRLLHVAASIAPRVAYYLPRTVDVEQVSDCGHVAASASWVCDGGAVRCPGSWTPPNDVVRGGDGEGEGQAQGRSGVLRCTIALAGTARLHRDSARTLLPSNHMASTVSDAARGWLRRVVGWHWFCAVYVIVSRFEAAQQLQLRPLACWRRWENAGLRFCVGDA